MTNTTKLNFSLVPLESTATPHTLFVFAPDPPSMPSPCGLWTGNTNQAEANAPATEVHGYMITNFPNERKL